MMALPAETLFPVPQTNTVRTRRGVRIHEKKGGGGSKWQS